MWMSGVLYALACATNSTPIVLIRESLLGLAVSRIPASEYLLCLKFRDRLDPVGFRSGKGDLVARMQRV